MKWLAVLLVILLALLQYHLWLGRTSVGEMWRMRQDVQAQLRQNTGLAERNRVLAAEVSDLKTGQAAIEERARNELGMIKKGETFYQIAGAPDNSP